MKNVMSRSMINEARWRASRCGLLSIFEGNIFLTLFIVTIPDQERGTSHLTHKISRAVWWKISEGKFVTNQFGSLPDSSTNALIRDLIESETALRILREKAISEMSDARIVEAPLPFEPIHVWLTWTMGGNKVDH